MFDLYVGKFIAVRFPEIMSHFSLYKLHVVGIAERWHKRRRWYGEYPLAMPMCLSKCVAGPYAAPERAKSWVPLPPLSLMPAAYAHLSSKPQYTTSLSAHVRTESSTSSESGPS